VQVDVLERLACPDCRNGLVLDGGAAEAAVSEGSLACVACGRRFEVRSGIPRLLPGAAPTRAQQATAEHFTGEFTAFTDGDRDLGDPALNRWIFYTRTGLDPQLLALPRQDWYPTVVPEQAPAPDGSELRGKWVLDAGCGPGRLANVAAPDAGRLIGLDIGDHIDRAAQVCSAHGNVGFVQGSVLAPPFAAGSFDVVYSVGVLHHSPDPAGAVLALAGLVRPGGRLCVWVYPPEYWGGRLRGPVNRAVHRYVRDLPIARRHRLAVRLLYPLGRLQERVARRRWTKLLLAPLFLLSVPRLPQRDAMIATILDYFGPRIVSTHSPQEVAGWLRAAGLEDVGTLPVRSSASGRQPATATA
jgi:SAM-dependent methyltransferase/uncharacterized protein YbaR (Trm112 family)